MHSLSYMLYFVSIYNTSPLKRIIFILKLFLGLISSFKGEFINMACAKQESLIIENKVYSILYIYLVSYQDRVIGMTKLTN